MSISMKGTLKVDHTDDWYRFGLGVKGSMRAFGRVEGRRTR